MKSSFAWEAIGIMYKTLKLYNECLTHFQMALKLNTERRGIANIVSNILLYKENYSKVLDLRKN